MDVFNKLKRGYDNFIISHRDLDTLMGIMWASKFIMPSETAKTIGKLVGLQDVHGFHWMEKNYLNKLDDDIKYRFLDLGLILNTRDFELDNGEVIVDLSKSTHKILLKMKDMITDGPNEKQKKAIDEWLIKKQFEAKKDLIVGGIINFFKTDKNLLSAYKIDDKFSDLNLIYNYANGSILLSAFSEKIAEKYFGEEGVIKPLQEFFGKDAGGRKSVGGSARHIRNTFEDAKMFYQYLTKHYINNNQLFIENIV